MALRGASMHCSAQASTQAPDLQSLKKALVEDTDNMFGDKGTDTSVYAQKVKFRDPITKYDDIQGFVRNLDFLKSVFDPTYQILGFRDVNDTDTLARWTMGFDVLPIQRSPLGRWWWPRLEFTGTTLYGTSAKTGLIERHLDTWDSIEHQEYFSLQGFRHMLGQIFTLRAPPQLRGPDFTLLKRKANYSLRRYDTLHYVQCAQGHSGGEQARRALASLLFPGTTSSTGQQGMCTSGVGYVLPEQSSATGNDVSAGDALSFEQAAGVFASVPMKGSLSPESVAAHAKALADLLRADGMQLEQGCGGGVQAFVLQHTAPGTTLRQSDLLMQVGDGFDLWSS